MTTPTVWALLGRRAGDNAQILTLAEGLGFRLERKQLRFNRQSALPNVLLGASLLGLAPESRDLLQPPWPDAIVTAGGAAFRPRAGFAGNRGAPFV